MQSQRESTGLSQAHRPSGRKSDSPKQTTTPSLSRYLAEQDPVQTFFVSGKNSTRREKETRDDLAAWDARFGRAAWSGSHISNSSQYDSVETMDTTSTPPFRITKSVLARAVSLQFATWLAEQTDAEGRSSPSESRAQGVDGDNLQPTTSNGNRSRKRKGKEKISSSQDDQEDGDGSSNGRDKKPKLSKGSQTNGKLFACPFAKRRPQPLACCVERGFENTSRVKEHIYRRHFVFQCVRCGTVFGKKEHWKGHQRSTQACEVVVYELCSNAINQDKQEAMRCRVGLTNMSEEEKWHHIYKIIYPDAVHPYPSPYLESDSGVSILENFISFARDEMPSLITTEVNMLPSDVITLDVGGQRLIQEMMERIIENLRNDFLRFRPSPLVHLPLAQVRPEEPEEPEEPAAARDAIDETYINGSLGFDAAQEEIHDFLENCTIDYFCFSNLGSEQQEALSDILGEP